MNGRGKRTNGWTGTMRWIARALALAVTGLFVYFLVEFGPQVIPALSWTSPQGAPLLVGIVTAVVGLLIAWRWELVGALMAAIGASVTMALVCWGAGTDMLYCAVMFSLPILTAAVLYLACCWRTRAAQVPRKA